MSKAGKALIAAAALLGGLFLFNIEQSQGTARYASPSGSGTACTQGSPCALSTANGQAAVGDVIYLADGTYTTQIAPAVSGTGWAPGTRITYIGNTTTPDNVIINSTTKIQRSYMTIRGMKFTNSITLSSESPLTTEIKGDSLVQIVLGGGISLLGVQKSVVADFTGVGGALELNNTYNPAAPGNYFNADRDTFIDGRVTLTSTSDRSLFKIGHDQVSPGNGNLIPATYCLLKRVHVDIVAGVGNTCTIPVEFRGLQKSRIENCYTRATSVDTDFRPMYQRERCIQNVWVSDTLIATGAYSNNIYINATGDNTLARSGDNNYTNCIFTNTTTNGLILYEDGVRSDSLIGNTFTAASGPALQIARVQTAPEESPTASGVTLMDHNTFTTFGAATSCVLVAENNGWDTGAKIKATNNLFYKRGSSGTPTCIYYRFPGAYAKSNVIAGNNTFVNWAFTTNQGDRSISWRDGGNLFFSRPGFGSAFYNAVGTADGGSGWAGLTAGGTAATTGGWGGLALTDTSSSTAINVTPTVSSAAILQHASDCGDVGAIQLTAGANAPSAITDLTASPTDLYTVSLRWTAPTGCNNSPVTEYQLVFSQSTVITDGNIGSFSSVTGGVPLPAQPGVTQGTFSAVCPGYTWYFAIRARSGAANPWSLISNVPSAITSTVLSNEPCEVD